MEHLVLWVEECLQLHERRQELKLNTVRLNDLIEVEDSKEAWCEPRHDSTEPSKKPSAFQLACLKHLSSGIERSRAVPCPRAARAPG